MTALLPGFYRHRIFGSHAVRVDHVHGHLDSEANPVVDITWLKRCPTGWRVAHSDVWQVICSFATEFEPMDPPR